MTADEPLQIVSCILFPKEAEYLAQKNGWKIETAFLSSNGPTSNR